MRILRFAWIVLVVGVFTSMWVDAAPGSKTRDLFIDRTSQGMAVKVLRWTPSGLAETDPGHVFVGGDRIKLELKSNFDGYVYLINITPSGQRRIIFPYSLTTNNRITAMGTVTFPEGDDYIGFDNKAGQEVLEIHLANAVIPRFEEARNAANGLLEPDPAPPAFAAVDAANEKILEVAQAPGKGSGGAFVPVSMTRSLRVGRTRDLGIVVGVNPGMGFNGTGALPPSSSLKFQLRFNHAPK